jgi:protein subunit release factor B
MAERDKKRGYTTDLEALYREVRVEYYRSRGPGGQRKNKKETAVRVKHHPTGVTVTATESRYQAVNKRRAFQRLHERLCQLNRPSNVRIPTVVSLEKKDKRGQEKRRLSLKKRWRRAVDPEDFG